LMYDLREKRMEYAQAMLLVLHATERDGWHHLVIGDKLWFPWSIITSHVDSVEIYYSHKAETW
jgi:hypothetical protein